MSDFTWLSDVELADDPKEETDGNVLEEINEGSKEGAPSLENVNTIQSSDYNTKKRGRPKGTPSRKAPNFITPPKKSLFRKRKANPDLWQKNVRKKLRLSGKEYTSAKGTLVAERSMKPINCSKCIYKCSNNFSADKRSQIFDTFWSLESYERKKDFIISNTNEKKTRTYLDDDDQPVLKKKSVHRSYSLTSNGNKIKVCKKFFLATLGISEAFSNHAMQNQKDGVFAGADRRGRHVPHNKTSENSKAEVRKHIESFPVVNGHYTRKDSTRKYLGPDLNITRMYQLYLNEVKDKLSENDVVSSAIYRKIFNEEYNYSFYVPKKDQCSVCIRFHKATDEGCVTREIKEEYENHQDRLIKVHEEKKRDRTLAKQSKNLFVANFDLQADLSTPCSHVSQLYNTRKLSCYNLSINNMANSHATSYLWSEVDAQRGSCEISTCLYLQLLAMPNNIDHVIFYSDACSGQNRNQYTATCLFQAVKSHRAIKTIDHKFLESGHTQMECNSMHSAIEFAKKNTEMFIPQQWSTVIRMARRKEPYVVVPLKYDDIYDFKALCKNSMNFRQEDTNGAKINWLQIKWLRYSKETPDCIQFKYDFDQEFRKMEACVPKQNGRQNATETPSEIPKKYASKQPISEAKKRDLLRLCETGVIPSEYTEFYKSLPTSTTALDKLADTDVEEDRDDSDDE